MGEQLLIENGAPTLANLKTASLFTVSAKTSEEARRLLEDWLPVLARKGVSLEILRDRGNSLLVYLYREGRLRRDLCQCLARERLCREDAPLRAVVDGRVQSVGENWYDGAILRCCGDREQKVAPIIGLALGREKLLIGDWLVAQRIMALLSSGALRMVREQPGRFYDSSVQRV